MKVSSRVDYALSCILRIADKYNKKKPATISEIAEKEKLETDYVEQLCVIMKRTGILKSIRGKSGGYVLARPPARISAKDIMMAIDKNVLEPVCFRKKGRRKKCVHLNDCKVRVLWKGLLDCMESYLSKNTLDKLSRLRRKERNW
jgi:Rrf2 family protein